MKWFESKLPGPGGPARTWKTTGINLLDAYITPSGDKNRPWSLLVNVVIPVFGIYRQDGITRHATVQEAMDHAEEVLASYRTEFQRLVDLCDEASCPHVVTSLGDKGAYFASKRAQWERETCYTFPGAIQYYGPEEVCDITTRTLALEQA